MNMNDFYNTGSDILDAVNDAVSRNDFTDLNATIKKTVREVSETIQRDVREYSKADAREDIRRRTYRSTRGQGGTTYQGNPYRRYKTAEAPGDHKPADRTRKDPGRRFWRVYRSQFPLWKSHCPGCRGDRRRGLRTFGNCADPGCFCICDHDGTQGQGVGIPLLRVRKDHR